MTRSARPERLDAVVYDLEIACAIPEHGVECDPDIKYCDGWTDYRGMGIAVIAAIDLVSIRSYVYLDDNRDHFRRLIEGRCVISFNGRAFDDRVLRAHGVDVETHWDVRVELLEAIKRQLGTSKGAGRTLGAWAAANGFGEKELEGACAPVLWQRGDEGTVINYCLDDAWKTARLAVRAARQQAVDPLTGAVIQGVREVPVIQPSLF